MTAPARILIIDDHVILRRGLGLVFGTEPDMEVVGEAGTVADALEAAGELQPDVAVLDIHLPDGSGIAAIRPLHERAPSWPSSCCRCTTTSTMRAARSQRVQSAMCSSHRRRTSC